MSGARIKLDQLTKNFKKRLAVAATTAFVAMIVIAAVVIVIAGIGIATGSAP